MISHQCITSKISQRSIASQVSYKCVTSVLIGLVLFLGMKRSTERYRHLLSSSTSCVCVKGIGQVREEGWVVVKIVLSYP